jgi:two-component system, NtrC family, sensor histidine kinase HydH
MVKRLLVQEPSFLDSLKLYIGFTERSSEVLRSIHPIVWPHASAIVDDFYATIEAHPGARAVITGGAAQIQRLKQTLIRWLGEVMLGPHDEAYFLRRARIGRVHVRIDLPQAYMLTAMDRIRTKVAEVLERELAQDPERRREALVALHQILDVELAIMLETYREDLLRKNRTAERLSTIGQFAAGIGHELRNPLGVVESSAFLLRQHLQQMSLTDPKLLRHLDKITAEVQRSNKTINDLLELARHRPPKRRRVAVTTLVSTALAGAPLPADMAVVIDAPDGISADVDPDQVARLLINLFVNAHQAMGGRGRIHVQADRGERETHLRVWDEGPGVPVDVQHRIFEALFTTKAKGTGLGLALCRQIAEAHGGTIALEPTDRGACFLITLPDEADGLAGDPP